MSPLLKAVIVANGLGMLLSLLLLQLFMSFCHTTTSAIDAAARAAALNSLAAAELQVAFCPRRLLLAAQLHAHQVELIKLQLYQNKPSYPNPPTSPKSALVAAQLVDSSHTFINNAAIPPQLSNSSSSTISTADIHQNQQQQDLQVGSTAAPHDDQDTDEQEKRYVPAGPNPLHNR
ncbi:hypothetical protein GOP47_0018299 [Adiantum capillus-veneris]|uniref:Uncharacterized protein n=1 Tax=Adiantum capillus-veneris TaxID=13818 RepID=A0A9D4UI63_ADICA|nr:hypothetical protein GOP47_0018299 [Adiantum capillus-veneris]